MEMIFCANCEKRCGFKRSLGFGTLFMIVFTAGFWILTIPFYPARCINCGLTRSSAFWENFQHEPRRPITGSGMVAIGVILLLALIWLAGPSTRQKSSPQVAIGSAIHIAHPNRNQSQIATVRPGRTILQSHQSSVAPNEAVGDSLHTRTVSGSFHTYTNARFGFFIEYPDEFLTQEPPQNGDGVTLFSRDHQSILVVAGGNSSGISLGEYYDQAVSRLHEEPTYVKLDGNSFVLSWTEGNQIVYLKMFVGRGSNNSLEFRYPESQRTEYESVVSELESTFHHGDIDRSW